MRYRLTVRDELSDRLAEGFTPVQTERVGGRTRLTVEVQDQAQLLGIVSRLGDLGIELIAITPVTAAPDPPSDRP